ncbi:MAG: hypothetical protein ACKO5X_05245 [Limnohabitans sp.]
MSLLLHLLNFVAPAFAVAAWVALVSPLLQGHYPRWRSWRRQFFVNSIIGVCVLLLGLLWFGNDGKVVTYAAMVLVCASTQWLLTL